MINLFRHFHPTKKAFSFSRGGSRSLIDMFMASRTLSNHVAQCSIGKMHLQDHRPLLLLLRPRIALDIGPGLRRTQLAFLSSDVLKEHLQHAFVTLLGTEPSDDQTFIDWWPAVKKSLLFICKKLDHQQFLHDSSLSQVECEAKSLLDAALFSLEEEVDASKHAELLHSRNSHWVQDHHHQE